MNVREKLIWLISKAKYICANDYSDHTEDEYIADTLLDNGVTVQEWISVDDKLPPYNRDVLVYRPNMAMEILVDNYAGYYGEDDNEWHEGWAKYGKDIHGKSIITHWAYLPQPPKGE